MSETRYCRFRNIDVTFVTKVDEELGNPKATGQNTECGDQTDECEKFGCKYYHGGWGQSGSKDPFKK